MSKHATHTIYHADDYAPADPITGEMVYNQEHATYVTRDEAIRREIIAPIEASGVVEDAEAEYDVEAIAEEVLGDYEAGYACQVTPAEFWTIVERYAL